MLSRMHNTSGSHTMLPNNDYDTEVHEETLHAPHTARFAPPSNSEETTTGIDGEHLRLSSALENSPDAETNGAESALAVRRMPTHRPPPPLAEWESDDHLIAILCRVPYIVHGTVRALCRRFRVLLASRSFYNMRRSSGWGENVPIFAGGWQNHLANDDGKKSWWYLTGQWRSCEPMVEQRFKACAAVLQDEMWICGGSACNQQHKSVEVVRHAVRERVVLRAPTAEHTGFLVCATYDGHARS